MGTGSTLRWRIVVVQLAAALLPLALAGFGSWLVFGNLLEQKSSELLQTTIQGHARTIDANLQDRMHSLQLVAATHSMGELSDSVFLRRTLADLNRVSNEGFIDLGVFNAAGDHVAYVGPYNLRGLNYKDEEWFQSVAAEGVYISDVFMGYRQVPHCIVAVKHSNGEGEGWVLRATINSHQFDRLVQSSELGEGGDVFIVNQDGRYQTAPRNGSLLNRAPELLINIHPGVKETRAKIAGSDQIVVTTWINNNRWLLVALQQVAAVKAPVNKAIGEGALVVALSILLLVATTFLATRHLTNRIDRANAEREEANQAFIRSAKLASIGELATGLAHEINNPLAIISAEQTNIADLLTDAARDPEALKQMHDSIERCRTQVKRCADITGKMLQFGRIGGAGVQPTEIGEHLKGTMRLFERKAQARRIQIETELEVRLPRVMVDPVEFEQVMVNLLNNSIDAMPEGGSIVIAARQEESNLHVQVIDDGTGVRPGDLPRMFEPFFTTKPPGKGTGLGLSVCYGLVQSWGGLISADSEYGKGTTIDLWLPVDPTDREAGPSGALS